MIDRITDGVDMFGRGGGCCPMVFRAGVYLLLCWFWCWFWFGYLLGQGRG